MKTNRNFLSGADRADLVKIVRDGLEEHRIVRRANAILLLDKGWSFAAIAEALFLDNSTIRIWLKEFQEGGVEAIVLFDLKGGAGRLSPLQIDELRAWATEALPTSTTEIGQFILDRFGFDYGRSGLIKLMNRIGFDWKKPESVPGKIDVETQQKFIDAHEDLRNSLGPDETVVYVDAVHPTHQAKPAGRWLPRGQRCALPAASGRDRLNLHGAIDLETGQTSIMDVQTVDAASTIALFEALERSHSTMSRIHVFLDNARYHHAKVVQGWLQQPGRRIVLHFVPSYCPHLNPIERLWKVMHENVTHNRCYAKFRDFAEAVLGFLRETVPQRFDKFSSTVTDNFRVIDPRDFRILACKGIATGARRKVQYSVNTRLCPTRARIDCFFNQPRNHRHSQHPDVDQFTSASFCLVASASGPGLYTRPNPGIALILPGRPTTRLRGIVRNRPPARCALSTAE